MKLFLILIAAGAACFFGWNSFNHMIHPTAGPSLVSQAVKAEDKPKPTGDGPSAGGVALPALPAVPQVPLGVPVQPPADPNANLKSPSVETILVYTFRNRPVPPPPFGRDKSAIGSSRDANGLELSVDQGANSWIMRGPSTEVMEVARIAEVVDVVQDELDLDFLLITVSETWLRSFGVSAAYQEGAAWLPSFSLSDGSGGLRLASGGFAVDLTASMSDSSASVYSAPVVRCVTGEKWSFGADREIPIESTTRADGVQQSSYSYRSVGLGFSGSLAKAGPKGAYRLQVEQRNGDVESSGGVDKLPPVIRSQLLQTSLVVEIGRWSCVGGVSSWRKEKKKRLIGVSDSEEQNLLLVFVRPRDALSLAPVAHAVGQGPEHLDPLTGNAWDLGPDESALLPPKHWIDEEIELVEKKISEMKRNPARK